MAKQPLPYIDIPPEPFASRLLFLATSIRPPCSVEEMIAHLKLPRKKDWSLWKRDGNLQSEDTATRTKAWMIWVESLADLLLTHTLIDFAALKTCRFPSGVSYEGKCEFEPAYLWLRPEDVWWFVCHLMAIPPERWLPKDCTAGQLSLLEEAVKRWGQAFLYPRHNLPEVATLLPGCAFQESSPESAGPVRQLEHALKRLFVWLDAWQTCPYDTLGLLQSLGELAKVYYEVYNSLTQLLLGEQLHREQADRPVTLATSAPSQICVKVAARFVYLMVGRQIEGASSLSGLAELPLTTPSPRQEPSPSYDETTEIANSTYDYNEYLRYRFRTALRQSYRLVDLIHRFVIWWEQPSEHNYGFVHPVYSICDFWEWHAAEIVKGILYFSGADFERYVALSAQQQAELETRVKRYLLGKGCIKRYRNLLATLGHGKQTSTDHSNRGAALPIFEWLNKFALLPYNAVDLVHSVNELQKHVWAYHEVLVEQWLANVSNHLRG
ncbi:MAG: hypothetical protein KatS3mg022_0823 [Armatimonadota bacterium]|nr:MAG: hypothetical protein KatS3mg022_0823 [Armatimonadota bacterium]